MTPGVVVATGVGAVLAAGLLALVVTIHGTTMVVVPRPVGVWRRRWHQVSSPHLARRSVAAVGVGVVVLVTTRWPVAAAAITGLILSWPVLFGAAHDTHRQITQLQALAAWAESLQDTVAGAVGLEAAIPASVPAAHPILQPHLRVLLARLMSRTPMEEALTQLAQELDNPSADLVLAALVLNARLRGPGLVHTLHALSAAAREELDLQRRIEAQHRGIRRGAQIVVVITVGFAVGMGVFSPDFVAPYTHPGGQVALLVVVGIFGTGFAWLRALSRPDRPERFLTHPTPPGGTTARVGSGHG